MAPSAAVDVDDPAMAQTHQVVDDQAEAAVVGAAHDVERRPGASLRPTSVTGTVVGQPVQVAAASAATRAGSAPRTGTPGASPRRAGLVVLGR